MADIFEIRVRPLSGRNFKIIKSFNAESKTNTKEELIASGLYEGYLKTKSNGEVLITKYYTSGYSYYRLEGGKFIPDVTDSKEVSGLNHDLIGQLFSEYKTGSKEAVKLSEAYRFLKAQRSVDKNSSQDTITLDMKKIPRYEYQIFPAFIKDILEHPEKYNKLIHEICRIVYNKSQSLYGTNYSEDMVDYPNWLKPLGFETDRLSNTRWVMSAQINKKIIKSDVTYDSKGISKYGAVGEVELAGKLLEQYILTLLYPSYKKFTENNLEYKIVKVADIISKYLSNEIEKDFRENYHKRQSPKAPGEFIVDMSVILHDLRLGAVNIDKNAIYEVTKYFKNNPDIFKARASRANYYMEQFYPWFEYRISNNKNLFKNVPED